MPDLSAGLYARYHVSVIPMCVALDERMCRYGVDVNPEHTVVPYRNIPKKLYPTNIPKEESPCEPLKSITEN